MKRTIWKYELEVKDEQVVVLPAGAAPLSVAVQNGKVCLWALVSPEEKEVWDARVSIYGTGHPITRNDNDGALWSKFVGTVQLHDGALVFHVFID